MSCPSSLHFRLTLATFSTGDKTYVSLILVYGNLGVILVIGVCSPFRLAMRHTFRAFLVFVHLHLLATP